MLSLILITCSDEPLQGGDRKLTQDKFMALIWINVTERYQMIYCKLKKLYLTKILF